MTSISVRPLDRSEWLAFKDLRLLALRDTPGVFALSYEQEAKRSPEEWQETIQGPSHQVFGLFDSQRLIGITASFTWQGDPSGETAVLAMSFIRPEYRGHGLSRLLYDARLDWIRRQPQFKRVVVSHRASNEASRRANQRHLFHLTGRSQRTWPDGATEDEIWYELRIRD